MVLRAEAQFSSEFSGCSARGGKFLYYSQMETELFSSFPGVPSICGRRAREILGAQKTVISVLELLEN